MADSNDLLDDNFEVATNPSSQLINWIIDNTHNVGKLCYVILEELGRGPIGVQETIDAAFLMSKFTNIPPKASSELLDKIIEANYADKDRLKAGELAEVLYERFYNATNRSESVEEQMYEIQEFFAQIRVPFTLKPQTNIYDDIISKEDKSEYKRFNWLREMNSTSIFQTFIDEYHSITKSLEDSITNRNLVEMQRILNGLYSISADYFDDISTRIAENHAIGYHPSEINNFAIGFKSDLERLIIDTIRLSGFSGVRSHININDKISDKSPSPDSYLSLYSLSKYIETYMTAPKHMKRAIPLPLLREIEVESQDEA